MSSCSSACVPALAAKAPALGYRQPGARPVRRGFGQGVACCFLGFCAGRLVVCQWPLWSCDSGHKLDSTMPQLTTTLPSCPPQPLAGAVRVTSTPSAVCTSMPSRAVPTCLFGVMVGFVGGLVGAIRLPRRTVAFRSFVTAGLWVESSALGAKAHGVSEHRLAALRLPLGQAKRRQLPVLCTFMRCEEVLPRTSAVQVCRRAGAVSHLQIRPSIVLDRNIRF